jgi:hypothetical protein
MGRFRGPFPDIAFEETQMISFDTALARGRVGTDEALAIFDSLEPVDVAFMLGDWRGTGFPTGHVLDGMLEACHWHGKHFIDGERVHPLVFRGERAGQAFTIRPLGARWALRLLQRFPQLKSPAVARMARSLLPLLRTSQPMARLRMTTFRGRLSAAMIYDDAPIIDVFRRVDANTVLGLMDMKGLDRPFFFVLRRVR